MNDTATATPSATATFTDKGCLSSTNTARSTPYEHCLLTRPPGDIIMACWALETLATFSENLGAPISKKQAKEWLKNATCPPEGWGRTSREDWIEFRLDGIGELI